VGIKLSGGSRSDPPDDDICYGVKSLFTFYRVGGNGRQLDRFFFDFFQDNLNSFFQLRIVTIDNHFRNIVDFDIGGDADVFDIPLALEVDEGDLGDGDGTAVHERDITRNADQSAPGTGSDEWSQAQFAEIVGEGIAARSGEFIDKAYQVTVNGGYGSQADAHVSSGPEAEQFAVEAFQEQVGYHAAGVIANVDDNTFFSDLGEEGAVEFIQAGRTGIGDMDISDFSIGCLVDLGAVVLDPIDIADAIFRS